MRMTVTLERSKRRPRIAPGESVLSRAGVESRPYQPLPAAVWPCGREGRGHDVATLGGVDTHAPGPLEDSVKPEVGIHRDVDMSVYAAWEAKNCSTLKLFSRSAMHAREAIIHPREQTTALEVGQAVHCAVLEPDKFPELYCRGIKVDRRTKVGKADWAAFEAENADKLILKHEDFTLCNTLRDKCWKHPRASQLLGGDGANELSMVWDDPESGQRCKGRLDRITTDDGWTTVVDLKTAEDASPGGFSRAIARYSYEMQAAFYLDGLEVLDPRERRFLFLAVEKEPPHAIGIYELEPAAIELGRWEYRRHMTAWIEAEETGEWAGYSPEVVDLDLPAWRYKAAEEGKSYEW